MQAPSIPRVAIGSLPLTLFMMVCFVGLIALIKIPAVGLQLEPMVCEAGQTMTSQGVDDDVVYFCGDADGKTQAETSSIIFWTFASYVILWMLIVWPAITLVRYWMSADYIRLERDGIRASALIVSARQTRLVVNRMPVIEYELEVATEGGTPFTNKVRKTTPELFMPQLQPGRTIPVMIDPRSPKKAILQLEKIPPIAPPMADDDGDEEDLNVLRKLKAMLDEGLIKQSEYDAKKAQIMDRM